MPGPHRIPVNIINLYQSPVYTISKGYEDDRHLIDHGQKRAYAFSKSQIIHGQKPLRFSTLSELLASDPPKENLRAAIPTAALWDPLQDPRKSFILANAFGATAIGDSRETSFIDMLNQFMAVRVPSAVRAWKVTGRKTMENMAKEQMMMWSMLVFAMVTVITVLILAMVIKPWQYIGSV